LSHPTGSGLLVAGWYAGLTAVTVLLAYASRGLGRRAGWLIMALYALFAAGLVSTT
jgi:hypothetical protein